MENWKLLSRISTISGIVFVVFAVVSAFTIYESIQVQYGSLAPTRLVQLSIIGSMLPYLLGAVIAFVVSGFTSRAAAKNALGQEEVTEPHEEKEAQPLETNPEPEAPKG